MGKSQSCLSEVEKKNNKVFAVEKRGFGIIYGFRVSAFYN